MILSTSWPFSLSARSPAFSNCVKSFLICLWSFLSSTMASVDMVLLGRCPVVCWTRTHPPPSGTRPDAQKPRREPSGASYVGLGQSPTFLAAWVVAFEAAVAVFLAVVPVALALLLGR